MSTNASVTDVDQARQDTNVKLLHCALSLLLCAGMIDKIILPVSREAHINGE